MKIVSYVFLSSFAVPYFAILIVLFLSGHVWDLTSDDYGLFDAVLVSLLVALLCAVICIPTMLVPSVVSLAVYFFCLKWCKHCKPALVLVAFQAIGGFVGYVYQSSYFEPLYLVEFLVLGVVAGSVNFLLAVRLFKDKLNRYLPQFT